MSEQNKRAGRGGSFRRRRPQSGDKPRQPKGANPTGDKPKSEAEAEGEGEGQKRERPASYSWPVESIGKTETGTVVTVIRRGKFNFGFISLSTAEDFFDSKHPRVYFNPSHVGTAGLFLRTGYQVSFTAANDEAGRSMATDIVLTEEGIKTKDEREEAIAKKRAERQSTGEQAAGGEEKERRKRPPRRTRPVVDGKKVSLKVTCEGQQDTKVVEADLGHSIGELRANAAALFDAPSNYGIYAGSEFLNKTSYNELNDNDVIHLAPRKEN